MLPRTMSVLLILLILVVLVPVARAQELSRVMECTPDGPAVYCIWIEPHISPDTQSYAFTDGSTWPPWYEWWPHITIVAADGSSRVILSPPISGWSQSPAWSPDGSQLAFTTTSYTDDEIGLWVVDLSNPAKPQQYQHLVKGQRAFEPAWSRSGHRIAYSAEGSVWTVDRQGGSPSVLLPDARSPSWGPEDQIVFVRSGDLWIRQANGDVRQLTNTTWREEQPAWGPDGTWIAYASDRQGNGDIWLIAASGGTAVRLTSTVADESNPSWSGDGTTIMFHSLADKDEFWLATSLPDFTVSVQRKSWGELKQLYR